MADFIRARSCEQKAQRLAEIKSAAAHQFAERPYHEITLTTIADELGWSRANLYKYTATKEEIFLALAEDSRIAYFDALLAAFPEECGYSLPVIAEVWSGILNAHRDYLRYHDILLSIIETNVTIERLAAFKQRYYEAESTLLKQVAPVLGIEETQARRLLYRTLYQATGLNSNCAKHPLIKQALDHVGIDAAEPDFKEEMRDFIEMALVHERER